MSARNLHTIDPADASLWHKLLEMRHQQQMAQTLLWVTPAYVPILPVMDRVLALMLCTADAAPCGRCVACQKILSDYHPDIYRIEPETKQAQIKVDQIRALQHTVYQTPQLGGRSLVVIYPTEALNLAASSALLKIIEEPPPTVTFILFTAQLKQLLPTLISRCQIFSMSETHSINDPLLLGSMYPKESVRAEMAEQRLLLLADLDAYFSGQYSPCTLAERWAKYPIDDMVWFLYILTAKLIRQSLMPSAGLETEYRSFKLFSHPWNEVNLFQQLDCISGMMLQFQQNIHLNSSLVLERILLGYRDGGKTDAD